MIELQLGDFRDLIQQLPDDSVDLVLTDPPYPKPFRPLWSDLGREAARVLKPGKFLVTLSGQHGFLENAFRLSQHLNYYWLKWISHQGRSALRFEVKAFNNGKPVLIYYKPPRRWPVRCCVDLIQGGGREKEFHPWQQGLLSTTTLLEAFTMPGDLVVDPFAGAGTVLAAAFQLRRRAIGYEIDPGHYERACERLDEEIESHLNAWRRGAK